VKVEYRKSLHESFLIKLSTTQKAYANQENFVYGDTTPLISFEFPSNELMSFTLNYIEAFITFLSARTCHVMSDFSGMHARGLR
jgi:hypothetical protein